MTGRLGHTRRRSKPVAVVTSTIPITIDKFHRELIRQVQVAGYDVCVVSSPGVELTRVRDEMSVRVRSLAMTRQVSPIADVIALVQWLWVCLAERPSLLVSATPKASLLSMLAGKATRARRRIYYVGGLRLEGEHGRRRQLLWVMEWLTSCASTEVVANSPSLAAQYAEQRLTSKHKLRRTLPGSSHGVDSRHFSPQPRDPKLAAELGMNLSVPVIGLVGRLTHDKGVDALSDAMALLDAEGISCQLLVVGYQNESDSAVHLDTLASLGDHVAVVGEVADVRPYFALMDVHVLPSLREGFPNVVLEASAMGVPTVVTDATGAIDSVKDGKTGLIVKTQDPRGLADAIKTLLRDPDKASRYGLAARAWVVDDFQPESVVQTLLAFSNVPNAHAPQNTGERSNVTERR
jgi:glycosyltransferase involved in cell wall biosynthesis